MWRSSISRRRERSLSGAISHTRPSGRRRPRWRKFSRRRRKTHHSFEGDGTPDVKPIEQARAEASWLQKFIGEKAGSDVDIQPVVIYPGWYVENEVRGARVWVLNENALVQFLDYRPEVLNQERISILSQKLEEYIRSKNA